MSDAVDIKIRDMLEQNGWRRENSYVGSKVKERWEKAYEFFKNQIKNSE